jgi:3-hydroxybutyryl-CoA dehydratase
VTEATFTVSVTAETPLDFARLSGDWNPLHTDAEHAARTAYRHPVLHGAYSAGLLSRMAGMHIPGADCLLHNLRLRFLAPLIPPATLKVTGRAVREREDGGSVEVSVTDATTGTLYVEGGYDYGHHRVAAAAAQAAAPAAATARSAVLVTGATGGLGGALMARLGSRAIGVSRSAREGMLHAPDLEHIDSIPAGVALEAIVHCAWPAPDNVPLTRLPDIATPVEHHVSAPLRQMLALARLLAERGTPDALLVLVGSTFSAPGRHNYRMPLYTLAKGLVPELARVLAVELGASGRRCVSVVYDVVDAGMNERLSAKGRQVHADRTPSGKLPTADDAAGQIEWVLANRSVLLSGASLTLSGGALP